MVKADENPRRRAVRRGRGTGVSQPGPRVLGRTSDELFRKRTGYRGGTRRGRRPGPRPHTAGPRPPPGDRHSHTTIVDSRTRYRRRGHGGARPPLPAPGLGHTAPRPASPVSRRTPDRTGGAPPPAPGPDRRATRGQPVTASHGASRGPSPGPLALGSARLGTVRLAARGEPRRSENRIDIESSRSYNTYLIRQVNIFHLKVPTSVLLLVRPRGEDSSAVG